MFQFDFNGGVVKPTEHVNEKFLLFFLVGGKEIPMYQMLNDGLAVRPDWEKMQYQTNFNICKLFVAQKGFGVANRFFSFYMKLLPAGDPASIISVRPFSLEKTGLYFKSKLLFLKRDEVLKVIDERSESAKWYQKQGMLATRVLQSMVSVDKSEMKRGVRAVRISKK